MFCSKCGNRVPDNARFCEKCGTNLLEENAVSQPIAQDVARKLEDATPGDSKSKKKIAVIIISIIVVIITVLGVLEHFSYSCHDCDKRVFFTSYYREDGDGKVAVCKDCFSRKSDEYFDSSNIKKGGYTLDEVTNSVVRMLENNDLNEIDPYVHPLASDFYYYCYDNFTEDESVYVDCHMELFTYLETQKAEEIYFTEDTACIVEEVLYSEEELQPLIEDFKNFLMDNKSDDSVYDYALIDIRAESNDFDISVGVVAVETDIGWCLLALD